MKKVMFLYTGNSCCSKMAEGFAREFGKGIERLRAAGFIMKRGGDMEERD